MRIIQEGSPGQIKKILREIKVDPYGIKIMQPKAVGRLIRTGSIPTMAANILKQEMLSLGGDAAVSRNCLLGKDKKTDCLIMGNLSQIRQLKDKLARQPFGLARLAQKVNQTLENYEKENLLLKAGESNFHLKNRFLVMGIINLTPDSFSGDGIYADSDSAYLNFRERAICLAEKLSAEGADILDIGGESSRPGAREVSVKEELKRVLPVIIALRKRLKIPLSIDTYKPQVAKAALDNGVCLVNDITGLKDPLIVKLLSKSQAAVVIMHMKGNPRTMQKKAVYDSLMEEIINFLNSAVEKAVSAGIERTRIIVDPGIGFAKTLSHNLEILKRLNELKVLGLPIMVGTSRKSFIGKLLKNQPGERIFGTVSSCVLAAIQGARILRVHDVRAVKEALKIIQATSRA